MNAQRTNVFLLVFTVIGLIVVGVVVLHLVAVGGIYAFNRHKASHMERETAGAQMTAQANPGHSYTVKKGDTATSIARNYGLTAEELLKANRITDPKKLQPGQTLKVPPGKS